MVRLPKVGDMRLFGGYAGMFAWIRRNALCSFLLPGPAVVAALSGGMKKSFVFVLDPP